MTAYAVTKRSPLESPKGKGKLTTKITAALPVILALVLLASVVLSFGFGAYPLSFGRALDILFHLFWPFSSLSHPNWDVREVTVMEVIQPPRILVATFAGIALGMSGTALQGLMRNPLVGPDLVGVTSGAALGGVLATGLGWSSTGIIALAFGGGLLAMACTFALAELVQERADGISLILAGFFVGAFFLACVGFCININLGGQGPGLVYWLLGSFRGEDPQKVWMIAIPTALGGAMLMLIRWRLNLLSLGDLDAASLGIDVKYLRWMIIAIITLMVSSQVAVSGTVGWVGLVVPHCARMLVGPDHRRLLPTSAVLGGLFMLGLDDLTRSIIAAEIPVGVLTAFFGTPLICFLFWKTQSRGWSKG